MMETGTSNEHTRSFPENASTEIARFPTNLSLSFAGSNSSRRSVDSAGPTTIDLGWMVRHSQETLHRQTWTASFDELQIVTNRETDPDPDRICPNPAAETSLIGIVPFGNELARISPSAFEQPCDDAASNTVTNRRFAKMPRSLLTLRLP